VRASALGCANRAFPMVRSLDSIFGFLLAIGVLAIAARAQSVPQIADGKVVGTGFTVVVPAGLTALPAATAESSHGFYIDLDPANHGMPERAPKLSSRFIVFDTRWDDGSMPTLNAVVDSILSDLRDYVPDQVRSSSEVIVNGNLPARLGGLPARRLVLKFKNSAHKPALRQILIGYDQRKDAAAVVYLLILNTTEQDFEDDIGVFSKLLAGFKVTSE